MKKKSHEPKRKNLIKKLESSQENFNNREFIYFNEEWNPDDN